jgi:hypothetical protein
MGIGQLANTLPQSIPAGRFGKRESEGDNEHCCEPLGRVQTFLDIN